MLTISNFIKKYPGNTEPVLSIIEYSLGKGIYWIKGENGSGKTSLMKSIAGMLPFSGDINVNGFHIHKNRMNYTSVVNYAEAEPVYPSFLTGKELIDFYSATKKGVFPETLMNELGVAKFQHQKIATYSSGMLKKLSLVLAFVGNPVLILLDEPLIALDIASVSILQSSIIEYNKAGVSFLITSHQSLDDQIMNSAVALLVKDHSLQLIAP